MSDRIVLPYTPQERQDRLHKSRARQILYGGAAGGGKSHALRWDAIELCLANPGLDAYLFRRTLPELESNHIRKLRAELPKQLGDYNGTRKRYEFYNGSGINFCHCETEDDVLNYQGAEMHWLGIDEAGQFTSYQIAYLRSRNRVGEFARRIPEGYRDFVPRCVLSANPGGRSHHYLKAMFIDPAPPETIFHDETMKNPDNPDHKGWTTVFIPAKMRDNKYLDDDYAGQFGGLPDWMQKMLRDGDWNVAAGAFFDCWDERKNVIQAFEVPDHWTKFPSVDWGHATPFSIGWWAVVSEETEVHGKVLPRGALVRYREWYGAKPGKEKNLGLKLDGAEVGRRAREMTQEKNFSVGVGDPSAWRSDGGPSQAEKMVQSGLLIRRADNERKAGWQEMYNRIRGIKSPETDEFVPMLYVFDTCREFIRTVPALPTDEKDPEEVGRMAEDHIGDETRYACMSRPLAKDKPKQKRGVLSPLTFLDVAGDVTKLTVERFRSRI